MGFASGWKSAVQSVAQTIAQLVGQDIVAKSITLTQAAASTAVQITTGAYLKLGGGTTDYLISNGTTTIQSAGPFTSGGVITTANGILFSDFVDDSANAGNRTVNANRGKNAIAAGAATCVITCNKVTATRQVLCSLEANDATALYIRSVVPSGTGFTITVNAAATANLVFSWVVMD
jgi:hypothetical protein